MAQAGILQVCAHILQSHVDAQMGSLMLSGLPSCIWLLASGLLPS